MSRTCRFFSPAASRIDEMGLSVSSLHTLADVPDCDTCWNTSLGAREDQPAVCFHADEMEGCAGYEPEPLHISKRVRVDRGADLPDAVARYVFADVVEGRLGYSQDIIFVQRLECDTDDNVADPVSVSRSIVFREVLSEDGSQARQRALDVIEAQLIEQPHEELTPPALATTIPSYFATIHQKSEPVSA